MKRPRRRRLHYAAHTENEIRATIKTAVPQDGVFADWLLECMLQHVEGVSEFERGVAEGRRRLAEEILATAMSNEPELKVIV